MRHKHDLQPISSTWASKCVCYSPTAYYVSLLVSLIGIANPLRTDVAVSPFSHSSHQPALPALPLRTASSSLMIPARNLGVSGDFSLFLIYHLISPTAYCFSPPKYLSYLSLLLIFTSVTLIHFDSGPLSSLLAFNHAVKSVIHHAANAGFLHVDLTMSLLLFFQ